MNQTIINEAFLLYHREERSYYADGTFDADRTDADRMTITTACDLLDEKFEVPEADGTIEIVHVLQATK